MGIKGLMKLIGDEATGCVKEGEMKNYFGRKIAIDASMWYVLCRFLANFYKDAIFGTFVQNLAHEIIFSNDELHIILKHSNLDLFLIIDEIVF